LLQIRLVSNHQTDYIFTTIVFKLFDPFFQIFEGSWSGNIIDQKGTVGTPIICTCHRPVPLLASSVPDLYFDWFVIDHDRLGSKLHSNRRLWLEVELVFCESRDNVRLSNSWVANKDNFVMKVCLLFFLRHWIFR
jgi:hypothetical protein